MAVAYLTSDPTDPMLDEVNSQIAVFFIGSGSIRTFVFQTLAAGVLVTTTPDLHSFHLKRSSVYPVHYAYLHHSIVSTHRAYRPTAFDHFDSVLCVGPHHRRETRAREQLKGLKAKCLFEHGYWPLDWLLEERSRSDVPQTLSDALNVLVAPSWGPQGLIEIGAEPIVAELLKAGHRVVVRPHPVTMARNERALRELVARFGKHSRFKLDPNTANMSALLDAHIMVSDWSGVAMEFAFGLGRPVVFIDGPPKVNNRHWGELGILPLEEAYRTDVGALVSRDRVSDLPKIIKTLWKKRGEYATRTSRLARQYVYNMGSSSKAGARIIAELVRQGLPTSMNAES